MRLAPLFVALVTACSTMSPTGPGPGDDDDTQPANDAGTPGPDGGGSPDGSAQLPAPELGGGDHGPLSVDLTAVSASGDLNDPTGVGVDPVSGAIWVVNHADDTWTIYEGGGGGQRFYDESHHFLRHPAAIAFIGDGERALATCQDSENGGDLFMGPTAWTSDLSKFEGGRASHYDMLHESPDCTGIAWSHDHVFFVFDGYNSVIDRVDFHGWHPDASGGLGGEDHSDGEYFRYESTSVSGLAGVHSGMAVGADGYLYVADTGNGRVVRLPANDVTGAPIPSVQDEVPMYTVPGSFEDIVPPGVLEQPSGLALKGDIIYVSDYATGLFHAFATDGTQVNWLDSGLGPHHVGALAFAPDGKLLFVDPAGQRLVRIDPH